MCVATLAGVMHQLFEGGGEWGVPAAVALVSFGWTVVFSLMQGKSLTAKQLEGALDNQDIFLDNLPATAPERSRAMAEKLGEGKDSPVLSQIPPLPLRQTVLGNPAVAADSSSTSNIHT